MNLQESIRRIVRDYIEEARLSDLLRVSGDQNELHKYIEKEKSKEFEIDRDLPTQLTLKRRFNNKKIKVHFNWYDNSKHDLKRRIKERTSFKSITEFTYVFKDVINNMLPDTIGVNINENGRYAVNLSEYGITIIFSINLDKIQNNELDINVITILPKNQVDMKFIKYFFVY